MSHLQPFSGFPKAGLQFLANLAVNNNRDWFEAHKETYQTHLLKPAQAFVETLGQKLQTVSSDIRVDTRTNGSGVLMRIYRDTRFSKDKSPYKTNISGLFWEGSGKKTEHPAFGFQLEANALRLMAGIFHFPKPMLAAYRNAIVNEESGAELAEALSSLTKTGVYTLHGEHYKRVPRGFESDHPRANLLRYSGLYVSPPEIGVGQLTSPDLVDSCFGHFLAMAPVQQWLLKIGHS